VVERRSFLFMRHRQRGPQLQAMRAVRLADQILRRALGMHDAAAGRHPVDGARLDALHRAQAVAVIHRAFKQIRHGGQADMRMRTHVMVGIQRHVERTEMVEENERAHRLLDGGWQEAAHHQAAAQVFLMAPQQICYAHDVIPVR
jgi:hypothetical protein